MTEPVFRLLSDEEKKAKVLSRGTRVDFFLCPYCGLNRKLTRYARKGDEQRIRFDAVDLDNAKFLQARYCGGRGSGFYLKEEESLTLDQVIESGQYNDLLEQIRAHSRKMLQRLK